MGLFGGGGDDPQQRVTEYRMSLHMGICQGPVDSLQALIFREKTGWTGDVKDHAHFTIEDNEIFGGVRKEGGVAGQVYYQKGTADQLVHDITAGRYGRTPQTMTGYRGLATLMFTGPVETRYSDPRPGFYWTANSPYMPPVWATVTRLPSPWYPAKKGIPQLIDEESIAEHSVTVTLNPKVHGGATLSEAVTNGLTMSGFDPAQTVTFYLPADQAFGAWSPWGKPALNGSKTGSMHKFRVIKDGDETTVAEAGDGLLYDGYAAALAAYQGIELTLTGASTYTVFLIDDPMSDNTGELVIKASAGAVIPNRVDANPAHIIYECLTNRNFGLGLPTTLIDDANFRAVADVLYNERLGLSMIWVQQAKIEEFVREVLDHIQAALFLHPRTGLFTLKLLRGDYDPSTLRVLDTTNSQVKTFLRQSPAEVTNELIVSWTNPKNEKNETVTIQNLGAIAAANGQINSEPRKYYGARTGRLARDMGARDMRASSAPLATAELTASHKFWDLTPGEPIKLTSPRHGITELVFRVAEVRQAKKGRPGIEVKLIEDVFALPTPNIELPPEPIGPPEPSQPQNVDYVWLSTLPYFIAANFLPSSVFSGASHPNVFAGVLAASELPDALEFELRAESTDFAGNVTWESLGLKPMTARGTLQAALAWEASSAIPDSTFGALTVGGGPQAGGLLIIGDGVETSEEIALLQSHDGVSTWTVARGVLDTTPRAWPIGTPIWFLTVDDLPADKTVRTAADVVDYKLLLRTTGGILSVADAVVHSETLTERLYLPLRPANVKINGSAFVSPVDGTDVALDPIPVTWAIRNRLTEDSTVLAWTAAGVAPESGQTTKITIRDASNDALLSEFSGLTGELYNIPRSAFSGVPIAKVQVASERDVFTSAQSYEAEVLIDIGYGEAYGYSYGGEATPPAEALLDENGYPLRDENNDYLWG